MKKKLFFTLTVIFLTSASFSQEQKISIKKPSSGNKLSYEATTENNDVKKLNTAKDIILSPEDAISGIEYVLKKENSAGDDMNNHISGNRIIAITGGPTLHLTVKSNDFEDLIVADIGKDYQDQKGSDESNNTQKTGDEITALEYLRSGTAKPEFADDPLYVTNILSGKRYFSNQNKAYIVLDENGKLIGNLPVNLDQDDKIYIYLVVDKNDINKYDLEVVGGEYAPVDLQIRSYEKIKSVEIHGFVAEDWTIIRFERGPYTSKNVTFNIKMTNTVNSNEITKTLTTYTLNINKLYHVAIGVSFISTNLSKPDFDIFPLTDSTYTINTLNDGNRTMFTFNVIWYWYNTFKYFRKGSDLMRGRDVLKEPNWIERLNPTFGVSLDNDFKENWFFGATYEFARGGSLILGGHYGKVKELADKNFVVGETEFDGSKDDIKLTDKWDWGFFFGITLDTRIFNKLFSRN